MYSAFKHTDLNTDFRLYQIFIIYVSKGVLNRPDTWHEQIEVNRLQKCDRILDDVNVSIYDGTNDCFTSGRNGETSEVAYNNRIMYEHILSQGASYY